MSTPKKAFIDGIYHANIPKDGLAPMLALEWVAFQHDINVLRTVLNGCDFLTLRFTKKQYASEVVRYINDNLGL